jgi:sarcosine oxidase subunit alpha
MASTKKDYIGRVLAGRPGLVDPARPAVVGFKPVDPSQRLRAGGHFLKPGAARTAENDQGYLSSVAYSPSLGHWIGLGFLTQGPSRHGEILVLCDPVRGVEMEVAVCPPVFVDPEGARLHG